jgi:hypothetical protein
MIRLLQLKTCYTYLVGTLLPLLLLTTVHPSISSFLLELEIKHKHGGFNINYEKATVVWQQFGFGL